MAKYETSLHGNFGSVMNTLHNEIMNGSVSVSLEDSSSFFANGVRVEVRVYERYSWFGGNRLSLTITLIGNENALKLSAITAGGSNGIFFKINTVGEKTFLNRVRDVAEQMLK